MSYFFNKGDKPEKAGDFPGERVHDTTKLKEDGPAMLSDAAAELMRQSIIVLAEAAGTVPDGDHLDLTTKTLNWVWASVPGFGMPKTDKKVALIRADSHGGAVSMNPLTAGLCLSVWCANNIGHVLHQMSKEDPEQSSAAVLAGHKAEDFFDHFRILKAFASMELDMVELRKFLNFID